MAGSEGGSRFSPGPALALAGWAAFWLILQRVPGTLPWMKAPWLPGLALALAALAAPARAMALATAVPFAVLQIGLLASALAAGGPRGPLGGQVLRALAWLLAASAFAVAWQRRPRDWARAGFFLAHAAPAFLLAGLWARSRTLAGLGIALLALGAAWMFYLKPLLKAPKPGPQAPAWQRWTLRTTRILFLAAGAAFLATLARAPRWNLLAAWLVLAAALHLHHVKTWKGPRAQWAGLAAWAIGLGLLLAP